MKKLFALIAVFGMLLMGASVFAQEAEGEMPAADDTTQVAEEEMAMEPAEEEAVPVEEETEGGLSVLHTNLKTKFIEGGAGFMGAVLMTLIFGLALAFERVIYLSLATTNTEKLLLAVEDALEQGGVEAATVFCRKRPHRAAAFLSRGSGGRNAQPSQHLSDLRHW